MTRNFKTLEVGKYYVSEVSSHPVRIVESSNNSFLSSEGDTYRVNGTCAGERSNLYALTTEVTVTVTPVEPKKPREYWVTLSMGSKPVNIEERINMQENKREKLGGVSPYETILMREVMEGEE